MQTRTLTSAIGPWCLTLMLSAGLTSSAAADQPSDVRADLQGGQVKALFDGKTLEGWRGRDDLWSVEEGAIVGRTTEDNPIKGNTFLIFNQPIDGDFELTLQYKIDSGNSGIQYRSHVVDEAKFVISGYQADIDSTGRFTGIVYEEKGRGILAERGEEVAVAEDGEKVVDRFAEADDLAKGIHEDKWNDYRILVRGTTLEQFINESLMSRVIDGQTKKAAKSGLIALQLHRGPAMTVRFKNISIRTWD